MNLLTRLMARLRMMQYASTLHSTIGQPEHVLKQGKDDIEQTQKHLQQLNTNTEQVLKHLQLVRELMVEDGIHELLSSERYQQKNKLNQYEKQVYSQSGEDGILEEIFNRIGTTNRFFVEFGVGDEVENNTLYLLAQGWQGLWIESNTDRVKTIHRQFDSYIGDKLRVAQAMVTAENIEDLLRDNHVPDHFDLLSIDIDGNDYWVWKAIDQFKPRVVVIEYNANFFPPARLVVKYDAEKMWDRTSYFGASLKSLEILGTLKGYNLVGCGISGVNAFFVRKELCNDLFAQPFTAENHYEPPRYFLLRRVGHKRGFGEFEQI